MKGSLPLLLSMLCASVALAETPAALSPQTRAAASALVEEQLLVPLKKAEAKRSRFSRAAPVRVQRRVRLLDAVALTDVHGKAFVRFAIDVRSLSDDDARWQHGSVVGCAYLNERQLFVRRGQAYMNASIMLGADEAPQPDVCRAAPDPSAPLASN